MKALIGLIILYHLSLLVVPSQGYSYACMHRCDGRVDNFRCMNECEKGPTTTTSRTATSGSSHSGNSTEGSKIDVTSPAGIAMLSILGVVVVGVVVGIVVFKFWIVKKRRRAQAPIMPVGGGGVIAPQPYAPDPYIGPGPNAETDPSVTGTAVVYE